MVTSMEFLPRHFYFACNCPVTSHLPYNAERYQIGLVEHNGEFSDYWRIDIDGLCL